jgi:DNA-binding IclR family transcriptional regulator
VYLAHLDDPRLPERLVQSLSAELRTSVLSELAANRQAGVAVYEFADEGVRTIAVPVFDGDAVCATLAVVGIAAVIPEGIDSEPAAAVIAAGRALSDVVSGRTGQAEA